MTIRALSALQNRSQVASPIEGRRNTLEALPLRVDDGFVAQTRKQTPVPGLSSEGMVLEAIANPPAGAEVSSGSPGGPTAQPSTVQEGAPTPTHAPVSEGTTTPPRAPMTEGTPTPTAAPVTEAPTPPTSTPVTETPTPPTQGGGAMWDVFFDAREGTQIHQHSPIVLDLNHNGQADITGSNIVGNQRLEGQTVRGFDLNPSARQWSSMSVMRRPGDGAPKLPTGTTAQVFDAQGRLVRTVNADELRRMQSNPSWGGKHRGRRNGGGDMGFGLSAGMRVDFRDADGRLVGELRNDPRAKDVGQTRKGNDRFVYHYGNRNENEWTKPWSPQTGGDGLLVWDVDGDGKITSGKELFGHVDLNGQNAFQNGYEKLSHYFDANHDGVVAGEELRGLKIWEDRNGDGITQAGELVELSQHGVTSLNTSFNATDMRSSFGTNGAPAPQAPASGSTTTSGGTTSGTASTTAAATGSLGGLSSDLWRAAFGNAPQPRPDRPLDRLYQDMQLADVANLFSRIFG